MEEDYFDEIHYKYLQEWLKQPYGMFTTLEEHIQNNKCSLNLIKQAFLEGFNAGRQRRAEENWDSWNQK